MRLASVVVMAAVTGLLAASASAALADGPSATQTTATTVAPVSVSPKPTVAPDDVVVCHHDEEDTGTRIPGKPICHTRRQWREIAAAARDTVDSYEARGDSVNNMKGN